MIKCKETWKCSGIACVLTLQDERYPKGNKFKKNREDLFAVQLNKNSEGLVTVVVHAMKNV